MLTLILPVAAGLLAQSIKLFTGPKDRPRGWRNLFAYSGMPSGHSAIVVCLATVFYLEHGPDSPYFAVSAILALVVIRDALGIRRYLGQHGHMLNLLVKDLANDQVLDEQYPRLLERIGHTPAQVLAGSALGFTIGATGYILFL